MLLLSRLGNIGRADATDDAAAAAEWMGRNYLDVGGCVSDCASKQLDTMTSSLTTDHQSVTQRAGQLRTRCDLTADDINYQVAVPAIATHPAFFVDANCLLAWQTTMQPQYLTRNYRPNASLRANIVFLPLQLHVTSCAYRVAQKSKP